MLKNKLTKMNVVSHSRFIVIQTRNYFLPNQPNSRDSRKAQYLPLRIRKRIWISRHICDRQTEKVRRTLAIR